MKQIKYKRVQQPHKKQKTNIFLFFVRLLLIVKNVECGLSNLLVNDSYGTVTGHWSSITHIIEFQTSPTRLKPFKSMKMYDAYRLQRIYA